MYSQFFNLREMPFSIAPDPAYLYMSPRHQEALGHLLYGTGKYGGFVQLTGEVGTGKTTIIRTLLAQRLDNVDVAMIHNPRQSEREFVQSICDELGVVYNKADPTLKTLVDALNAYLIERHTAGRRTVLIIDEAQQLAPDVLEQVRLLTNLETNKEKLLRIMLVGQPELSDLLARQDLRQLAQRITARYHLTPLLADETGEYIGHRLQVAGGARDLFSAAAIQLIHQQAAGIPRLINILCDRALLGAYAQGLRQVTPELVKLAAAEILGTPAAQQRARLTLPGGWLRWAEGALILAGVLLATLLWLRTHPQPTLALAEPVIERPTAAAAAAAPLPLPLPLRGAAQISPAYASLNVLVQQLAQLWQPGVKFSAGKKLCVSLRGDHLECLKGNAEWSDLMAMNTPAVLTISERGTLHYVLLAALSNDSASLLGPNGSLQVPLTTLDPLWTGEYLLLWRRETSATAIGPDSQGGPIIWLRQRLAAKLGKPTNNLGSAAWDDELRLSVQQAQALIGVPPDGIAGPRTLLGLSSEPGPVLAARLARTP